MIRALWSASTGMIAQQFNLDMISNNLANANTVGFKKGRVDFEDLFYQTGREAGVPNTTGEQLPTAIQVGLGVRIAATPRMFSQGPMIQTGNPLDIAIEGDGFFKITMPDGTTAYTRDGSFKLDSEGNIVTSDGYKLEPVITIPEDTESIAITPDGNVVVKRAGSTEPEVLGQITLARFINPAGLKAIGKNLFVETAASGAPIEGNPGSEGFGTLQQGFLEASNVQVVEEMVRMIVAQRAYEFDSRAIQTADDMLRTANALKR